MKRTKVIVTMMLCLVMVSALFACGKTDKLEQSKGVASAEMTDAEIALLKEFGVLPSEIDLNFSNLVLSTKNGDYDMLKWRTDNELAGLDVMGEAFEYSGTVSYESTEYTVSRQSYSLADASTLNISDVYYGGDKESRVFASVNVSYNHFKDGSEEISVMGITKHTDLDTIFEIFGNNPVISHDDAMNLDIYDFRVSFNGLPTKVTVEWNTEKNCITHLTLLADSHNALPINSGLSALENFIKE